MVIQIMPEDDHRCIPIVVKLLNIMKRYVSKELMESEFIDWGDESRKIRKIISEDMINRASGSIIFKLILYKFRGKGFRTIIKLIVV